MVRVLFKCVALSILAFLYNNFYYEISSTSNTYIYSKENIVFIFFISIIFSIKYDVLKTIIQINKKNKNLKRIVLFGFITLFFFAINYIYINISEEYNIYKLENGTLFNNLIYLPEKYGYLNVSYLTILDFISSIIIISLELFREEIITCSSKELTKSKLRIGYIFERIVKFYFRYNLPIIFTINLLTIPRKYVNIAKLQNVAVTILIVTIIAFIIYIIKSLYMCDEKNKSKYGKDNLIVVLTMQNYKLCFSNQFTGALFDINRFYNKCFFKNLIINNKDYTIVSYDAIRYNLINTEQYKNMAYIVILKDNLINDILCGFNKKEFMLKLQNIEKSKRDFIVYSKLNKIRHRRLAKEIDNKYKYKMIKKLNIEEILNLFELNDEDGEIEKDEKIFENDMVDIYKAQENLLLYMDKSIDDTTKEELYREYLNSKTDDKVVINLNYRCSEESIKKWSEKMG